MTDIHKKFNISKTESMNLLADEIETLIRESRRRGALSALNMVMSKAGSFKTKSAEEIRKYVHQKFLAVAQGEDIE